MSKPRTNESFIQKEQLFIHVMGSFPAGRVTLFKWVKVNAALVVEHQKDEQKVSFIKTKAYQDEWGWVMGKRAMTSWRGKDQDTFLRDWRPITRNRFLQFQHDMAEVRDGPYEGRWERDCQLRAELAAELLADDSLTA